MDVARLALQYACRRGVTYAEARLVQADRESIIVANGAAEKVKTDLDWGLAVRVLKRGAWGFAATSDLSRAGARKVADLALGISHASARLSGEAVCLAPVSALKADWRSQVKIDPFAVSLEDKLELLSRCTQVMAKVKNIKVANGSMDFWRTGQVLLTSEGREIVQTNTITGAGIQAVAADAGDVQQRSYPSSFRGNWHTAGYEFVQEMDLPGNAARVAEEAVRLLKAPACPGGQTDIILDGDQLSLQIHESIGHPLELDRILGMELSYAGGSFVKLNDLGRLVYGSPLLNVVADATLERGVGSFGYDDEGVPGQRVRLIREGVLEGFLTNRETAAALGLPSGGAARASSWRRLPLVRMTNINLLPGQGRLEELFAGVKKGVFMATNRSWSIDDRRLNFQFGCEIGYQIKNGRLGKIFKNPVYNGITPQFWASMDAVAGQEEWGLWGTASCGKGQPTQAIAVGHGCSPARFRNVQVGTG